MDLSAVRTMTTKLKNARPKTKREASLLLIEARSIMEPFRGKYTNSDLSALEDEMCALDTLKDSLPGVGKI